MSKFTSMNYPKISIITPSFNQAQYLEETILSVIGQGYPSLEYIIIDGGSTDGSVDIIRKYADKIAYWVSEPDKGMYDAIQKGFDKSTGEIMGWINSDDMLHNKSLFVMAEVLSLDGVRWIQGLPNVFDEQGRIVKAKATGKWSRLRHFADDVCIQQDCTFWRRELWEEAGARMDTSLQLAGDFELWARFFKYEKLYTPYCLLGGFRLRREGQKSLEETKKYWLEAHNVLKRHKDPEVEQKLKKQKQLNQLKKIIQDTRILNLFAIRNRIDMALEAVHDFPPEIKFERETQHFYVEKYK